MRFNYFYRGKHRSRQQTHKLRNTAIVSLSPLLPMPFAPLAAADPPGGWGPIIECESGGKNINNYLYPEFTASGYFQITNGTWKANGGTEFASRAIGASFEEQKIVANRIYERRGNLDDWKASRSCWRGKTGDIEIEDDDEPTPEPEPQPERAEVQAEPEPEPETQTQRRPKPSPTPRQPTTEVDLEAEAESESSSSSIDGEVYVVVRGDTLSEIAARATANITWPELFEANRDVIGSNPHLIFPGQKLVVEG